MYSSDYKFTPSPGYSPMTPGSNLEYSPRTPGSPLEMGQLLLSVLTTTAYTVYRDLLTTDKTWRIGEFQKIAK